jgi:hypothetical protein
MRESIKRDRGFALVVTVSLMVLLSLLAVGLLSLSTIQLRQSSLADGMAEARANARLALIMAIGQLQEMTGPDTRITADADLLAEDSPNPHWTGVWRTRTDENLVAGEAGDYVIGHHDSDRYLTDSRADGGREITRPEAAGWLVSSPMDAEATPATAPADDWVTLLMADTATDEVRVEPIALDGGGRLA